MNDQRHLHPKVLFPTTVLPSGRFTGSEVVSQLFIDGLRRCGCEISVFGYKRAGGRHALATGEFAIGERPIETSEAGARAFKWLASGLARGLPYSSAKYGSTAYRRAVRNFFTEDPPALVVVDHAQLFWLTDTIPAGTPLVLLAHNVEHELYANEAPRRRHALDRRVYRREARLLEAIEAQLAGRATEVWTLTDHDREGFERLGANRTCTFAFPSEGTNRQTDVSKDYDVCLLGSWTWRPNAEGLRWFIESVHPLVPPDISIHVGGKGADWLHAYPRVHYHGLVPDAHEFLRRARVIAVPSTRGAGIQIKTLDAISTGSAVVATPLALRGIDDPPRSVRVAEAAGEFAERIRGLVTDGSCEVDSDALAWSDGRQARFYDDLAERMAELGVSSPLALARS
jgi:polysaccharide biosynthesis protein PslH